MIYIVPYPMLLTLDFFCIKKEPLYLGEKLLSTGRVHVHVTHDLNKMQIVYFCKVLWYNYSMDITLTKHTEEKIKNPNCAFCNAENAD